MEVPHVGRGTAIVDHGYGPAHLKLTVGETGDSQILTVDLNAWRPVVGDAGCIVCSIALADRAARIQGRRDGNRARLAVGHEMGVAVALTELDGLCRPDVQRKAPADLGEARGAAVPVVVLERDVEVRGYRDTPAVAHLKRHAGPSVPFAARGDRPDLEIGERDRPEQVERVVRLIALAFLVENVDRRVKCVRIASLAAVGRIGLPGDRIDRDYGRPPGSQGAGVCPRSTPSLVVCGLYRKSAKCWAVALVFDRHRHRTGEDAVVAAQNTRGDRRDHEVGDNGP